MPHYFSFHASNFALIFQHNRTPLALQVEGESGSA